MTKFSAKIKNESTSSVQTPPQVFHKIRTKLSEQFFIYMYCSLSKGMPILQYHTKSSKNSKIFHSSKFKDDQTQETQS